jgi:hypothetical protein
MNETADKTAEQWAAFQKIWLDTLSKMAQAGFTFTPEAAPPQVLRNIRSGILQALARSWDEFLRSPQFLEGMKVWMDNAMGFRRMTNDFLTKARHEMQNTAREDIDSVMLVVRHMETRILDRLEDLSTQISDLNRRVGELTGGQSTATTGRGQAPHRGSREIQSREPRRKP